MPMQLLNGDVSSPVNPAAYQPFNSRFDDMGVGLRHHFGAGTYAKETHIPAGVVLVQHKHSFGHLSILASGRVLVTDPKGSIEHVGPCALLIKANVAHEVCALTDAVWFCIHATGETDPDKIDHELVG
jgi:hypothetical protein